MYHVLDHENKDWKVWVILRPFKLYVNTLVSYDILEFWKNSLTKHIVFYIEKNIIITQSKKAYFKIIKTHKPIVHDYLQQIIIGKSIIMTYYMYKV